MPTQTFWNLEQAKRERLVAIATEEFAAHDYDSASITRIVARAGIAKGSLYQYFADKRDLFMYLVELSNRKRLEYVQREAPPAPDVPFWQLLRWQVGASTRAALAYPLLTQVFLRAVRSRLPFRDELLDGMQRLALEHWRGFVARGIEQGAVDASIDPELAAVLLNATFAELGAHILRQLGVGDAQLHTLDVARFETPEVERMFDAVIGMLERGLGCARPL